MIRRHSRLLRISLGLADALAVLLLIWVISALRFGHNWYWVWRNALPDIIAPPLILAGAWVAVLWSQGLYRLRSHWAFSSMVVEMLRAAVIMAVLTFAGLFLFNLPDVSRSFLVLQLPAMAVASLVMRATIHEILAWRRNSGANRRNLLIVGAGPTALRFGRELEAHPTIGLRVIGYVDGQANRPSMGWPFLGSYEQLPHILHDHVIDEVAVCLDMAEWDLVKEVVELCKAEGKIARIPLAGAILGDGRHYVEMLSDIAVLSVMQGPDRQVALAVKRGIDIAGALVGLILGSPVMLICAVAILLDTGRPIFFAQERVGLHGRRFRMIKFRTMVKDAEEQLSELQALNEIAGHAFKVTNDPRITRVGRFLRRTSIDELPQLWNVLNGSMSLVGPRPPMPIEVQEYDIWHRRRLSMKPGITGLWQVAARRESDFNRWVEKDLEYIDGWSLWLDARIALRTLPAMLRSEGR